MSRIPKRASFDIRYRILFNIRLFNQQKNIKNKKHNHKTVKLKRNFICILYQPLPEKEILNLSLIKTHPLLFKN